MAIYSLNHRAVGRATHNPGTAGAHVQYITRPSAARLVLAERMPEAPHQARAWLNDQEQSERKNGRVIDKVMVALPRELTPEQRAALVREFAGEVTQGRAPWLAAIHDQGKDAANPHAHIVIRDKDPETRRRVAGLNDMGRKQRDGSKTQSGTERLRVAWEKAANRALERAGHEARIDRRTLAAQGIDRKAQIHVGPRAKAMVERGKAPVSKIRKDHRGRVIRYPDIDLTVLGQKSRDQHNAKIINFNEQKSKNEALKWDLSHWEKSVIEAKEMGVSRFIKRAEIHLEVAKEFVAAKKPLPVFASQVAEIGDRRWTALEADRIAVERAAAERYEGLMRAHREAERAADPVVWQRHQWTEAHPWRARLHRLGLAKAVPLAEIEARLEAVQKAKKALEADTEGKRAYEAREAARRTQKVTQREQERQIIEPTAAKAKKTVNQDKGRGARITAELAQTNTAKLEEALQVRQAERTLQERQKQRQQEQAKGRKPAKARTPGRGGPDFGM